MRRFVALSAIIIVLFSRFAGLTQEIDLARVKPLILGAAEELRKVWMKSELSPKEYQETLDISCNALTSLSQDPDFEDLTKSYMENQYDETLAADVREVFLDFRSFLEFLEPERNLLLDAGLSEEAVDELLGQMTRVRLEAAAIKLNAEMLLADLRRLAEHACSASEEVTDYVEHEEMVCNLEWIVPAVFGGVAVVADIPLAFVPAWQLVSAVSFAAGSALISVAGALPQC